MIHFDLGCDLSPSCSHRQQARRGDSRRSADNLLQMRSSAGALPARRQTFPDLLFGMTWLAPAGRSIADLLRRP